MTLQEKIRFNMHLTDEEVKEMEKGMDPSLFIPYDQQDKDREAKRDWRTNEEKIVDGDLPLPKNKKIVDGKLVLKTYKELYDEGIISKEKYSDTQRQTRNFYLEQTDKYMIPDYPIKEKDREKMKEYREYLRHLPEDLNWPDVKIDLLELK